MAAVLAGADGWKANRIFSGSKLCWLRKYRVFKNGISTRHFIGRITRRLSNEVLLFSFALWINEQRENTGKLHIAIDGKTPRGSSKCSGTDALHVVNAMHRQTKTVKIVRAEGADSVLRLKDVDKQMEQQ